MPTNKPRITITLTDDQYHVLSKLSHLTGGSMSSAVVELVDTALPVLERVVAVLEAAKKAPKEMHSGIAESFEEAERNLLPLLDATMAQLNATMGPEAVAAIAGARSPKKGKPPSTNRGVRIPPPKSRKTTAHAGSSVVKRGVKK